MHTWYLSDTAVLRTRASCQDAAPDADELWMCRNDDFLFLISSCGLCPYISLTFFLQVRNQVVFWDRIIRRQEDAVIAVSGKNKYPFREFSTKFKYVDSPFVLPLVELPSPVIVVDTKPTFSEAQRQPITPLSITSCLT